jgi:hypothetical protein
MKKISLILIFILCISIGPIQVLADGLDANIYENDKAKKARGINNSDLQDTAIRALKFVGGWGGIVFTMAFMILAMMLGSGGVNPHKRNKVYVGLVTVAVAAFLFFSAWQFAPAIANVALSK